MVFHNTLRTWEEKHVLLDNAFQICDCSRSKQMPSADQINGTIAHVGTDFCATILYGYHDITWPVDLVRNSILELFYKVRYSE